MVHRWTLGLLAVFSLGCFSDIEQPPTTCPDGSSGCACYGNGTCDASLLCNPDNNCVSEDCLDGQVECPCYGNGTCDAGLMCTHSICQPLEVGTGSDSATSTTSRPTSGTVGSGPTTDEPSTTAEATSSPTASSSGPGEEATSDDTASSSGTPPPMCECAAGQACFPGDVCDDNPYVPCNGSKCPVDGQCISGGDNQTVCAPDCVGGSDCPVLADAPTPVCVNDRCVLPCAGSGECPSPIDECEQDSPVGIDHCFEPH